MAEKIFKDKKKGKFYVLTPLDDSIIEHVKCVHIMWSRCKQTYDDIKLHNTPH